MAQPAFSSRIMWRDLGRLVSYEYIPGKRGECGDDWDWNNGCASFEWQRLHMYVRMNDVGIANGVNRVWLGGRLVLDQTDVVYRLASNYSIETFTFQNFHGGSDSSFIPGQTQYQWCAATQL